MPMPDDPNLAKHRTREWFSYEILNASDRRLFTLARARKDFGRVDLNADSPIRGSGSFGWVDDPAQPKVDPLVHRVRIWQHVVAGGVEMEWPWITGPISMPKQQRSGGEDYMSAAILDKTSILDEDAIEEPLSMIAGASVTGSVKALILAGDASASFGITDSGLVLRAPMVWPAGTSRLRIVNDLLDSIGYFAVWCDGWGRYMSGPYTLPRDRPVRRAFNTGEGASLHKGTWSRSQNLTNVPNKVVAISRGGYELEVLVGRASLPPESPFSAANRGVEKVRVIEGVEASDQATIDMIAQRELAAALTPAVIWNVEHASMPLSLQDRVIFAPARMPQTSVTVRTMSIRLQVGATITAEWRGIE